MGVKSSILMDFSHPKIRVQERQQRLIDRIQHDKPSNLGARGQSVGRKTSICSVVGKKCKSNAPV